MGAIKERLTDEKFQEIYTNKKFRNDVANANGWYSSFDTGNKFKGFVTVSYPISYIVTEEQIKEARFLKEEQKEITLNSFREGQLVLVGMGMEFDENYDEDKDYWEHFLESKEKGHEEMSEEDEDAIVKDILEKEKSRSRIQASDIKNFRVRGYFLDRKGDKFFLEFSTCYNGLLHVDFSIKHTRKGKHYNYKKLDGCVDLDYNKENILKIVNYNFDVLFDEVVIDNYDLGCDEYVSISK